MTVPQARKFQPNDENRYRLLVEAVTDYAIYMLDVDGTVTSWNAGAQRFKGYTPAEIVGQHFSRFYTPEDQQSGLPRRNLGIAAREGRFESEGWRVRKDGTKFWAHVVIDPIHSPLGELIGYAKITRDLTKRRESEIALRQSEEQFRLLVQGVTDYAIYLLGPQGTVTNWNAGAERIKGYTADEVVGQHFSMFYTEDDRKAGLPQLALETATREGRFEKQGVRVRKDGTQFLANVVIDPIRGDDGAIIGFAKVTRDVTEREEALRQLEIAREALFQSQKIEAIGQLTGGVAHDFNNVLMAILSSLELMRKRLPDDERLNGLLDNAVQGTERGTALVKRMLAFARRQELHLQPVDVQALVRGMKELLQRTLGPSIIVETRFPLLLHAIQGDPNQLELALLNLAVNARDAMPEGGPLVIAAREETVSVDHALKLAPGPYICLSVTDTGEGMDEQTLAHAMEPFFTTKGAGKGTGLGLSMVHGVTEQSGGRMVLKSKKGAGTTVELWLPVAKSMPAAAAEAPAAPAEQTGTKHLTVLAVDDDALILMNTAAMLEDMGHRVLTASDGKEALEILRRETSIDVLITDHAMPGITGFELAEAAAKLHPAMPVILASGYAELPAGKGAELYRLAKPFWEHDLARVLAEAVQGPIAAKKAPAA